MPLYRVERRDGENTVVNALRMIEDAGELIFQAPRGDGQWKTNYRIEESEVKAVARRVTEVGGSVRWVPALPRLKAEV